MESPGAPLELGRICRENGLDLSDEQLRLLAAYVRSVIDWNGKINLMSRRDEGNIWFSHVLHSLSLLFYVDIPAGARILDLGTGGGFPGIPVAIARPDVRIVLLDSIRKKTTAVEEMVGNLALTAVTVWTGRAEDLSKGKDAAGAFDFVFTRAVASLGDLARWSRAYLKKREEPPDTARIRPPVLVALKGGDLESEISSARLRGRLRYVGVTPIAFAGSTSLGLEEKKIVAAYF